MNYRNGSERKRKYRNDNPFRKLIIHRERKRSIRLRSCLPQSKVREGKVDRGCRIRRSYADFQNYLIKTGRSFTKWDSRVTIYPLKYDIKTNINVISLQMY